MPPDERKSALVINESLKLAQQLYSDGERDANLIRNKMRQLIEEESIAEIDYISIADTETLNELNLIKDKALVSLVVKIGKPRLLDNVILGGPA